MSFEICPACAKFVRVVDAACPLCGASIAVEEPTVVETPWPTGTECPTHVPDTAGMCHSCGTIDRELQQDTPTKVISMQEWLAKHKKGAAT